jgi:hypothetical protein
MHVIRAVEEELVLGPTIRAATSRVARHDAREARAHGRRHSFDHGVDGLALGA